MKLEDAREAPAAKGQRPEVLGEPGAELASAVNGPMELHLLSEEQINAKLAKLIG